MFKIRKTAALAALFCSSVLNAWASADHMVIAMPQIPTIIEPQGINNNAIDRYVGNVFETLLKADQKTGELKPGLAESWCRLSPDTVEFKLRSGVRFHDGTPLTADDVVFTFGPERFSGEKAPGRAVAWEFLGNLKEVVKVDDLTVRVTMKAPDR
ncbi:MAG: ABC transporter substrate-binding protein [Sutterella wadsworthensis]